MGRVLPNGNMSHLFSNALRVCTAKVFDKSDPEGDDAAKRELKNLKSLRHERMVSPSGLVTHMYA